MADYSLNDLLDFFSDNGIDTEKIAQKRDDINLAQGDLLEAKDNADAQAKAAANQYIKSQEQKNQNKALDQFIKNVSPSIFNPNPVVPTPYSYPGPVSNEDISTFPAYTPILPPIGEVDKMLKLDEPAPTAPSKPIIKSANKPVIAPKENLPELPEELPQQPEITPEKPLSDIEKALLEAKKNREQANSIDAISQLITGVVGLNRAAPLTYDDSAAKLLREQADRPLEELKTAKESEKQDINLKTAKYQLADKEEQRNPNSQISIALRRFILDQGAAAGMKNLNIPEGLSYEALEKMYGHITDVFNAKLKSDTLKESIAARKQEKQVKLGEQMSLEDEKTAKKLSDSLNPNIKRTGAIGKNQARVDAAERLEALAVEKDGQFMNLTPQQMNELASGLDAMISANPSISGREHLTPESKSKWIANKLQWLTDNPKGADQMAFTMNMIDTVRREKEVAQGQIKKAQKQMLPAYEPFKKRNPQMYNSILSEYGLNEEDTTEKKNEKMVIMRSPKGKNIKVPESQVQEVIDAGGKRVQ